MQAKRSVLVVDDDADICANLHDILEDCGYRTDTAHDGPSALHLAANQAYDVALLDFKMPGIDGVALCKELRLLHPDIIAIMITDSSDCDFGARAQAAGLLSFLRKPLDLPSLLRLVEDTTNS